MDEEGQIRVGWALVIATVLALAAMVVAETFGFALFDDANDAVLTSKLVAESRDRFALRPEVVMTHPICVATMNTSVGGVVTHRGCYVPKAKK